MSDKIMPLSEAVEGYELFDKMKAQKGEGNENNALAPSLTSDKSSSRLRNRDLHTVLQCIRHACHNDLLAILDTHPIAGNHKQMSQIGKFWKFHQGDLRITRDTTMNIRCATTSSV